MIIENRTDRAVEVRQTWYRRPRDPSADVSQYDLVKIILPGKAERIEPVESWVTVHEWDEEEQREVRQQG